MNTTNTSKVRKPESWPKIRKFFNDIHLWLGLISGIVIFFVCLSGTIYVFNTELREMAAPQLYKVEAQESQKKLSAEKLISIIENKSGDIVSSIKIPSDPQRSYSITAKKKETDDKGTANQGYQAPVNNQQESSLIKDAASKNPDNPGKEIKKVNEQASKGTVYMINPYTGEILGDLQTTKTFTSEFMQLMFSLHRWLLLDKIEEPIFGELENRKLGSYISGTATILFTFGVITGIVIWIPKKTKNWKQGLKIKWNANWKRTNHDLHNSLGLYSCILLLLMGLTGPQWSFPWYKEGLRKTLGTYKPEDAPKPEPLKSMINEKSQRSLFLSDYINIATKQLVYDGDYTISLPADSAGTVTLTKNKKGFFAPAASDKIVLDQYSGEILQQEIFKDKPFNERISSSIKALHVGDVYGLFSKILYFFACLVATSLPITGTLIWINKLKKNPSKQVKTITIKT